MTKTSKTIAFFGNERLATGVNTTAPILSALIENGYDVACVIVSQNDPGKSRKSRGLAVAYVASQNNIPVYSLKEITGQADKGAANLFNADIGVLVAYGQIVPQQIIDAFPRGIVNIHPSLLPKHRGPTPIESVILNDEKLTGVSLMSLVSELDAGPVYAQEKVWVEEGISKDSLVRKLTNVGKDMLIQHLPAILDGSLKSQPQNEQQAKYDERIEKKASHLDFTKSAAHLEREVRAYAGWPRSRTKIGDVDVIITEAHVEDGRGEIGKIWRQDKHFGIFTSEGVLAIDSLIPAGKKEMTASAFLSGYKI